MIRIPERTSIVTQLANILREGIQKGEWSSHLPGQRALAEQLQVSRPTLRAALNQLKRQGYLHISHGKRMRVTFSEKRHRRIIKSKVIGFLSPIPLNNLSYLSLFLICNLERQLADAGFKLEIHTEARFRQKHPYKALERIVQQTRAACWILHFSTIDIQRWFSDRGLPAIVSKTRHEGIKLPSLDVDYKAIGTHAASHFLSLGHRRLTLLAGREISASDLIIAHGFREGIAQNSGEECTFSIVQQEITIRGIRSIVGTVFRSNNAPTGLLICGAASAITTLGHLSSMGVKVPDDVSLMCTVDDPLLAYTVPSIARYTVNWDSHSRRLSRLALQLATSGSIKAQQVRIIPQFLKGESLAPMKS